MKRKHRKKSDIVIVGSGPPCPRCKSPTQAREHEKITPKLLAQPFYYSRWYYCKNRKCRTTLIMPPEFIVENYNPVRSQPKETGNSTILKHEPEKGIAVNITTPTGA